MAGRKQKWFICSIVRFTRICNKSCNSTHATNSSRGRTASRTWIIHGATTLSDLRLGRFMLPDNRTVAMCARAIMESRRRSLLEEVRDVAKTARWHTSALEASAAFSRWCEPGVLSFCKLKSLHPGRPPIALPCIVIVNGLERKEQN